MSMRKIAVVGSFAAGAALALAPLAAADTFDPSILDGEISSMNSLFESQAAVAGDSGDVVMHTGSFDTILLADAPQTAPFTTLDYELYGINPAFAGPASDPGSYVVFNGALTEFYDAYNTDLYAMLNGGDLITADDLFGSVHTIATALGTDTVSGAFNTFFDAGMNDLLGYFDLPSLF